MDLYFLRHADAVPDGERPLSDKGIKQSEKVASALKDMGLELDALYTSPLVRAAQTAEIVGAALGVEPEVTDLLECGAGLDDLARLLRKRKPDDTVMVVGHEPDFSMMVGALIGGGIVVMNKAGIALVDCDEIAVGQGCLLWLAPPKRIRG